MKGIFQHYDAAVFSLACFPSCNSAPSLSEQIGWCPAGSFLDEINCNMRLPWMSFIFEEVTDVYIFCSTCMVMNSTCQERFCGCLSSSRPHQRQLCPYAAERSSGSPTIIAQSARSEGARASRLQHCHMLIASGNTSRSGSCHLSCCYIPSFPPCTCMVLS